MKRSDYIVVHTGMKTSNWFRIVPSLFVLSMQLWGQAPSRDIWFEAFVDASPNGVEAVLDSATKAQTPAARSFLERIALRYPKGQGSLQAIRGLTYFQDMDTPAFVGRLIRMPLNQRDRRALVEVLNQDLLHSDSALSQLIELLQLYAAQPQGMMMIEALQDRSWSDIKPEAATKFSAIIDSLLQGDTPLDKLVEQATFDLGRRMPKPQFHATCISLVQMAHESLFGVAASELLRSELDSAAQLVSQSILLETNEAARIRLLDSLITAGAPPSFWIEFTHTMARGGMSDAMMFRRVVGKISPSIMRPIIASLINKTTTSAGRYTVLTSSLASRRSFSVEWLESCWGDKDPLVSIVALQLLGLRKEKPDRVEGLLLTKSKLPLRLARMRTLIDVALPDEAVAAHCRRRLKSSRTHFQELMLLPELIKQTGAADWTLMDALRLVHHKKWAVQAKGLELLSHCRQRKAVRELIPFASHSRLLLSHAARLSLRSLTGKQLGEDPKAWEDWLDSQPREWTPRSKEKTAETPCEYGTSFYGMRIQSNRVIFVCDTSGSMSGGRIESLKEQIAVALKGLRADAAFNLIFFSSIVHAHFSSLVRAHKTTIKRAVGTTRKRQAHGGTNLYGGLIRAIKTHDVDTIILLSDGAPSAGKIVSTTNILKAVQQANIRKGIHIHTIYLAGPFAMAPGSNTCSRFLQDLAQQNSGTFKMITD